MEQIKSRSFARAGLLGNPSDGYFGKTLSFAFANYCVDLRLAESARMRFVPGEVDDATFDSPEKLVHDLRLFGYYGGVRMLKAVAKLFFEYCFEHGIRLPNRNFTAEYRTNIPRLVGLSGSSAICSAMLKGLMRFYGVTIPIEETPTICLEAERDELGINCGFQDRVIQMYGGLVFMDFNRDYVLAHNRGRYEPLDAGLIGAADPSSCADCLHLYIAFDPRRAEDSGRAHKKVKSLFEAKRADVLAAMSEFADIAQKGRDALVAGRLSEMPELIDANFDLRDRIFDISPQNRNMVMVARSAGASAKFAGSGGAIVGTYADEAQFALLSERLSAIGCTTIKPIIGTRELECCDIPGSMANWRNS